MLSENKTIGFILKISDRDNNIIDGFLAVNYVSMSSTFLVGSPSVLDIGFIICLGWMFLFVIFLDIS